MPVKINYDLCTSCGSCIDVCPEDVIQDVDGVTTIVNIDDCIDCLACVDECPEGAIDEME